MSVTTLRVRDGTCSHGTPRTLVPAAKLASKMKRLVKVADKVNEELEGLLRSVKGGWCDQSSRPCEMGMR